MPPDVCDYLRRSHGRTRCDSLEGSRTYAHLKSEVRLRSHVHRAGRSRTTGARLALGRHARGGRAGQLPNITTTRTQRT